MTTTTATATTASATTHIWGTLIYCAAKLNEANKTNLICSSGDLIEFASRRSGSWRGGGSVLLLLHFVPISSICAGNFPSTCYWFTDQHTQTTCPRAHYGCQYARVPIGKRLINNPYSTSFDRHSTSVAFLTSVNTGALMQRRSSRGAHTLTHTHSHGLARIEVVAIIGSLRSRGGAHTSQPAPSSPLCVCGVEPLAMRALAHTCTWRRFECASRMCVFSVRGVCELFFFCS